MTMDSHALSSSYTLPNGLSSAVGGAWMFGNYNFQVADIEVFIVG